MADTEQALDIDGERTRLRQELLPIVINNAQVHTDWDVRDHLDALGDLGYSRLEAMTVSYAIATAVDVNTGRLELP